MIFLFCKEIIGEFLKFIKVMVGFVQDSIFIIQASFRVDTKGWYCVANGNISFSSLYVLF